MSKKLKLHHNLDDVELEETLEKALSRLKSYNEPNRAYPDRLANNIKKETNEIYGKVINNMMKEINTVINRKN